MYKNFDDINDNYIDNKELARLELCILSAGYFQKDLSRFTKVSTKDNNKVEVDTEELESVSNSKEEKKNKKNQRKEQRDARLTNHLATAYLRQFSSMSALTMSVSKFSTPSIATILVS